jgi:uncharacterized protein (DUF58 family)
MTEIQNPNLNDEAYRLPTLLIIPLVQIIIAVFLFIALVNGQRGLTVLGLVIVAVLTGTKIWSRLGPIKVFHEARLDKRRGFPCETFVFSARVRNAKILPVLAELSVLLPKDFQTSGKPEMFQKSCSLLWYQETKFNWNLTAQRRGVYRIGTAYLKVGDLFGFYTRKPDTGDPVDVIVYPRLIPLKPLLLPRRELFGVPGTKSPIEDPVYVYGTREYQSGRPARYIHWKASARLARLQEKICEPATQVKILLIVEVVRFLEHQAYSEFEKILEVAASAAVAFDRAGIAVGLVTNGVLKGGGSSVVPIGRGNQQIPKILETLARLQMRPAAAMGDILRRGLKLPWGTTGVGLVYDIAGPCRDIHAFFNRRRGPIVSVVCQLNGRPMPEGDVSLGDVITLEAICMETAKVVQGSGLKVPG